MDKIAFSTILFFFLRKKMKGIDYFSHLMYIYNENINI